MKATQWMKRLAMAGLAAGLVTPAMAQDEPRRDAPRGGGLLGVLDQNGNGTLEADEIDRAVAALRKLDRDDDGTVSPEELRAVMRGPGGPRPEGDRPGGPRPEGDRPDGPRRPGQPAFERLDTDGDGKISKEEAPERMKERFDQIDSNGDGFIDTAEQEELAQRMRDRLRQRGDRPGRGAGDRPGADDGEGGTERPRRPEPRPE